MKKESNVDIVNKFIKYTQTHPACYSEDAFIFAYTLKEREQEEEFNNLDTFDFINKPKYCCYKNATFRKRQQYPTMFTCSDCGKQYEWVGIPEMSKKSGWSEKRPLPRVELKTPKMGVMLAVYRVFRESCCYVDITSKDLEALEKITGVKIPIYPSSSK